MKSTLKLALSLSIVTALAACGPGPEKPPSATASPTVAPTTAPTTASTTTPTAAPTTAPTAAPTTAPTAVPPIAVSQPPDAAFQITEASATLNRDKFDYTFSVKGQGMGSVSDYTFFQVVVGSATVPLVKNGQYQLNTALRAANLTDTELTFTWLPDGGSVTPSDEVNIIFEKTSGERKTSSKVRLSVN